MAGCPQPIYLTLLWSCQFRTYQWFQAGKPPKFSGGNRVVNTLTVQEAFTKSDKRTNPVTTSAMHNCCFALYFFEHRRQRHCIIKSYSGNAGDRNQVILHAQ